MQMNEEEVYNYIWSEGKGRNKLVKRMVDAYKRRKRKKKIEKLTNNDNHWKGLQ